MASSLLKGGICGGITVFVWSSIWWMALPFAEMNLRSFTGQDEFTRHITEHAPESGLYFLPYADRFGGATDAELEEQQAKMADGPIVLAVVQREGMNSIGGSMATQFVIMLLSAVMLTWLLMQSSFSSLWQRAGFVSFAALAAGVMCRLPDWNWWGYPFGHVFCQIVDLGVGWFLAGLVIARVTAADRRTHS